MKHVVLDLPTFALIVGTRAALAAGIGLLVSDKLSASRRRAIGTALVTIGAIATVPAAIAVVRSIRSSRPTLAESSVSRDDRLVGATRFPRKGDDDVA